MTTTVDAENDTETTAEIPAVTTTAGLPADDGGGESAAREVTPLAPWHVTARLWLAKVMAMLPRLWTERSPSLAEMFEFSRTGDWTPRKTGPRRGLHLLGTAVLLFPIRLAAGLLVGVALWVTTRHGRFFHTTLVTTVVATAANFLVDPVVPDFLTAPFLLGWIWPW